MIERDEQFNLTGELTELLMKALADAFRQKPALGLMASKCCGYDLRLFELPTLEETIIALISRAESDGHIGKLISCAIFEKPDNSKLQTVCRKIWEQMPLLRPRHLDSRDNNSLPHRPTLLEALPRLSALLNRLAPDNVQEAQARYFFLANDRDQPLYQTIWFERLRGSKASSGNLDSELYEWAHEPRSAPLFLVSHFPNDGTELLFSIAVRHEAGSLDGLSEAKVCWLSESGLLESEGLLLAQTTDTASILFLVDLSPSVLSQDEWDEQLTADATRSLALKSFCRAAFDHRHRVIVALPRVLLRERSLLRLIQSSPYLLIASELFGPPDADRRLELSQSLMGGEEPPALLRSLLCANSSSLSHEIIEFLHKRNRRLSDEMSITDCLALAERLFESGFSEISYRLELYCHTSTRRTGDITDCFSLDGVLRGIPIKTGAVVSRIRKLETAPQVISRAGLAGPAGSGKSTVLLQIERHWCLPPLFTSKRPDREPSELSYGDLELPLELNGRRCPAWVPILITAGAAELNHDSEWLQGEFRRSLELTSVHRSGLANSRLLSTHRWLSRNATLKSLQWIFSSRPLLLVDGFDLMPRSARATTREHLGSLLSAYSDSGLENSEPGLFLAERMFPTDTPYVDAVIDVEEFDVERCQRVAARRLGDERAAIARLDKLFELVDRPVSSLTRNPFLLDLLCSVIGTNSAPHDLNLYRLIRSHIESRLKLAGDQLLRVVLERRLPKFALAQKLAATGIEIAIPELEQEAAGQAENLGILRSTNDRKFAFLHDMVRDYFAARQLVNEIINQTNSPNGIMPPVINQILQELPTLSEEWKTVIRITVGELFDVGSDQLRHLVSRIAEKDARLAAVCLKELRDLNRLGDIPRDIVARALAGPSETALLGRGVIDVNDKIEAATAVGFLDPRIKLNDPIGGLVDIPATDDIPGFKIGRYPVTVLEFSQFVTEHGYEKENLWGPFGFARDKLVAQGIGSCPKYWRQSLYNKPNYPVVGVSLYEALAYCRWLTLRYNGKYQFGLPTETQWALAAGVTNLRIFSQIRILRRSIVAHRRELGLQSGSKPADKQKTNLADRWGRIVRFFARGSAGTDYIAIGPQENTIDKLIADFPSDMEATLEELKNLLAPNRRQLAWPSIMPIGCFCPASTGIYDLFGNTWEWCDEWEKQVVPASRPSGEGEDLELPAIVKGGPLAEDIDDVWHIIGGWFDPFTCFHRVGFRICCTPEVRVQR